ncbi:FAD-binding oxidoreductase [Amycolatopsis sp. WAC 01416]|uniref:FAD-binding oxidoreductase n=1 Tax=Amycolatopsis sp. WAC 01416 TaxID=2203196 RepID=UPI000F76E5B4|nr:FAD-binding oxidoreductase [Amycolatopsis sp. WAC 01416]RSN29490.1 FAD-binding oxidoreductase [Amycolatopsis sp. WAC 01416]
MFRSPSDADWRRLDHAVAGRVRRPGESGFRDASVPFNKRFAEITPRGVVSVTNTADVRTAIEWARDTGVDVVARCGGHSYAGHSVNTGLVIDLSPMNTVTADGSTGLVTVAGGARMADVYAAIQPCEMAFALGNGASVGIAGLTLGGGCGATSRAFGLTADALVATTVVTADGRVLRCDADDNADLFWACRGGGGGNFGINVSFTFQARPVADCASYLLLWDRADAPKVFSVLQEVARRAPDEFAVRIGVSKSGESDAVVSAIGQHLGTAEELREILDPVLSVARPIRMDLADRTFWEAKDDLLHETAEGAFSVRTNIVTEPLPDEAIATMLSFVDRLPPSGNPDGGGAALFSWGGAINRVGATETAFAHRNALFLLSMDTSWAENDEPAVVDANLRWLAELADALSPYVSDGAFQNFIDPDLEDWRTAYYGVNYPRLKAIKDRVDPDGVFTFSQSIGS